METDEALIDRARSGDVAAFDRVYERYEVKLFAYLRALLGDRAEAEEVFHDAFLRAIEADATRLDPGGFRPWLYRVARNLAFNRKRAAGRRDRAHAAARALEAVSSEGADASLESRELDVALARAVARLPNALGEVYHLRTCGLSYEQIASVVEIPIGTVKSRMHQMVTSLREELKPWIAPE